MRTLPRDLTDTGPLKQGADLVSIILFECQVASLGQTVPQRSRVRLRCRA